MLDRTRSWLSGRERFGAALASAVAVLLVGGFAVSFAASGTDSDRSGSDESAKQGTASSGDGERPEPSAEQRAAMEEFRDCMSGEGFDPPQPGERPERSEDGPPEGLKDAFEKCRDSLPERPEGARPGHGPGGPGCHGMPPADDAESRGSDEE